MSWKRHTLTSVFSLVIATTLLAGTAIAQSSSTNYQVDEVFFGVGGELEACSDSYCAKQSIGETAAGTTSSTNYEAQAGFNTTDVPLLEVAVNGNVDFGLLSAEATATGIASVQVRTYLASGYELLITGLPPYTANRTLDTSATPAASQTGTELFGINLRANSTPDIGADPVQIPDSTFSFGVPDSNYNLANSFAYQNGDVIAHSTSSSGQTNYTLSMIANIAATTPAGQYETSLSVVAVAKF